MLQLVDAPVRSGKRNADDSAQAAEVCECRTDECEKTRFKMRFGRAIDEHIGAAADLPRYCHCGISSSVALLVLPQRRWSTPCRAQSREPLAAGKC